MYQRVVMEKLDSTGGTKRVFALPPDSLRRSKADERPNALAAAADGITHGVNQYLRPRPDFAKKPVKLLFDQFEA